MQKRSFFLINWSIFIFTIGAIIWLSLDFLYPIYRQKNLIIKQAVAEEEDKTPPKVTEISLGGLSATSTAVSWLTDEAADSLVNFSTRQDYGIVRSPELIKAHDLIIPELQPEQRYYYRIIATDKYGNQTISNDYTFTTPALKEEAKPAPEERERPPETGQEPKTDLKESELVKETLGLLEKISSEEGLSLIESKIQEEAQEKAEPPVISGDFAKVEVGTDYAIVKWKTDKEANSIVALASEDDYNPNASNPYRWKEGEPNELVLAHTVNVANLRPATTYHYQVLSTSALGLEGVSEDNTFRTKSILPEIFNLNIAKVEEDSATIEWTTNVPCSAIVEYTDLNANTTKLEGSTALVTAHSIRLNGLKFDTYYSAVVKVENEQNEKTVSDPITFTTIKDVLPPVISKVNTESTLYPGAESKTQTIISWRTDEPSLCQFFYRQGLAVSKEEESSLPEEADYTTNHVQVVTEFQLASVYKFWIECHDKTLNRVKSEDYSMLTPAKEESILDLIIKNFEGTFGWLKKK